FSQSRAVTEGQESCSRLSTAPRFRSYRCSFSTGGLREREFRRSIAQFTERLGVFFVRRMAEERGRSVTSKADDYRRRARACLLMADTIVDDETRAALVEMAQAWTRLADEDVATAPAGHGCGVAARDAATAADPIQEKREVGGLSAASRS